MTPALLLAITLLQADAAAAPPAEGAPPPGEAPAAVTSPPTGEGEKPAPSASPAPESAAAPEAKPAEAAPGSAAGEAPTVAPVAGTAAAPLEPKPAADAQPTADGGTPTAAPVAEPAPGAGVATPAGPVAPPPPVAAPVAAACAASDAPARPARSSLPFLGYRFGVGFPEFAVVGIVVRPLSWLRAAVDYGYNYAGRGVQGELTLAPIRWYVSPTLNLAYGHYFRMDATKVGSVPSELRGLVSNVGFGYLSATLGLELGNQRHGMLVLKAGASRIRLDAPGTATFSGSAGGSAGTTTTTVEASGLTLKGFAPSFGLGWTLFL